MYHELTTWMYSNRIYVVSGGSSANSFLFENRKCHKYFFMYLQRFVTPMANILHYKLTPTGWALLIKTKSEEDIREAYFFQRNKSKKANRNLDLTEVNRMLSEHFRLFLSLFARSCNVHLERKGVVVMKRFDKYFVSNEKEYFREFEKICDLTFCSYKQIKKKYQPDESQLDFDHGNPDILQSSVKLYRGEIGVKYLPISLKIVRPFSSVLRKILSDYQNPQKPKNPPPKKE